MFDVSVDYIKTITNKAYSMRKTQNLSQKVSKSITFARLILPSDHLLFIFHKPPTSNPFIMSSTPTLIKLKSNDGETFEVEEKVARMSVTVNTLLQDLGITDDEPVPLPNVNAAILKLVLKWAEQHKDDPKIPEDEDDEDRERRFTDEIPPWDAEFLKVDQSTLFEIILAANYMDVKGLLDVSCQTVANMIKGKTPEEILKQFDIEYDFTPEEEEKIRKENEWLEEK